MKPLHSISKLFLLFMVGLLAISCQNITQKADLVITNASIWTGNKKLPRAEAMAIVGDNIIAVGTANNMKQLIGDNTEVRDLKGKFVTPGFIDSHVHLYQGGFNLSSVQLRDAKTKEEFIKRIGEYAKTIPEGTWILGGDWDHEHWGGELPTKKWIDSVTPNNPVLISRLDGHMALANSLALKLAGATKKTKDVSGGEI